MRTKKSKDIEERNRSARLWDKKVLFDTMVTKWADLWPDDVKYMMDLVERMNSSPKTIQEYRDWLK